MEITPEIRKKIRFEYSYWKPRTSPYTYGDWDKYFTPIEKILWNDLRFYGMTFYPQYPLGPYFLDFADPERKLCVEADGREFHMDWQKDHERDLALQKMGWNTIRVSGHAIKQGYEKDSIYRHHLLQMKYYPGLPPEEPLKEPEFV